MAKKFSSFIVLMFAIVCVLTACAHEHEWCDWQTSKKATCVQDGINVRVCDDCGESQSVPTAATGHVWGEWNTTQEASCTINGLKESICGTCGEKKTEIIFASHNWQNATCTEPKTCSKCGLTDGSALGHTAQFGCDRCGYSLAASLTCSNALSETFNDSGVVVQITERSFSHTDDHLIMVLTGKVLSANRRSLTLYFKITDANGNVLKSDYIYRSPIVKDLVFTASVSLKPTVAGEYTVTFYT